MNSMPHAMTIDLAHQHRSDLLAAADHQRLANAARRTTTGRTVLRAAPSRLWTATLASVIGRRGRGTDAAPAPAGTCA
jgi:hypothetical protein